MFTTVSKAGVGMYVTVATMIFSSLGWDFDEGTLTEVVVAILNAAGAVLWIAGQFARKDMSWGIFRKI